MKINLLFDSTPIWLHNRRLYVIGLLCHLASTTLVRFHLLANCKCLYFQSGKPWPLSNHLVLDFPGVLQPASTTGFVSICNPPTCLTYTKIPLTYYICTFQHLQIKENFTIPKYDSLTYTHDITWLHIVCTYYW